MNKHKEIIKKSCDLIKKSIKELSLKNLANQFNLSPSYFQKLFKQETGITPKEYAMAIRKNKAIELLNKKKKIIQIIYESGHSSSSRFYEKSDSFLGMTPKEYKKGGTAKKIMVAIGTCSLGHVLVGQSNKGICSILLGNNPEDLLKEFEKIFPNAEIIPGNEIFENNLGLVIAFVDMPKIGLDLPLDIQGTAFQQRVWKALQLIPIGQTVSYAELAEIIKQPTAVRAVANACGANKLAVAIPCHRVVQKNGGLGGYKWGIEKKTILLQKEK